MASIHPDRGRQPMINNDVLGKWFDEAPGAAAVAANLMPVDMIEPVDVSNAILFLVSDAGRYVTGQTLAVDAGFTVK